MHGKESCSMRTRIVIFAVLIALFLLPLALTPVAASTCGPGVTHIVQPGENLFRISLHYGVPMQTIAQANGIWNYALIYAGQTLYIPCTLYYVPDQPTYYVTPTQVPAVYQPPTIYVPPPSDSNGVLPPVYSNPSYYIPPIYVDCTRLYATSPLSGLAFGDNTFYWNPVPGATSYRVNVFSVDVNPGSLVGSWDTPSTRTSLVGYLGGTAGPGFRFAWEVQALVSDIPICTSGRYTMFRESP
jgi:LysM repeat protein